MATNYNCIVSAYHHRKMWKKITLSLFVLSILLVFVVESEAYQPRPQLERIRAQLEQQLEEAKTANEVDKIQTLEKV